MLACSMLTFSSLHCCLCLFSLCHVLFYLCACLPTCLLSVPSSAYVFLCPSCVWTEHEADRQTDSGACGTGSHAISLFALLLCTPACLSHLHYPAYACLACQYTMPTCILPTLPSSSYCWPLNSALLPAYHQPTCLPCYPARPYLTPYYPALLHFFYRCLTNLPYAYSLCLLFPCHTALPACPA